MAGVSRYRKYLERLLALCLLARGLSACEAKPSGPAELGTPGVSSREVRAPSAASATLPARPPRLEAEELSWEFLDTPVGRMHVVVSIPEREQNEKLPVLIALHGRGEALKGSARGARGWIDDYGLPRALSRLARPPLLSEDFGASVDASRLERLNQRLVEHPYEGLIVVCPYTPDILAGARAFSAAEPLARFLVDQLLPKVRRETPALGTMSSTGIDGVSLGGRAALLVGFERPESFAAVAALQAAIDQKEIARLTQLARQARKQNPKLLLRLLTSDQDYFRREIEALSQALDAAAVGHTLNVVPGDHSYAFNRGPGAYEMLTFHNWALRGHATL